MYMFTLRICSCWWCLCVSHQRWCCCKNCWVTKTSLVVTTQLGCKAVGRHWRPTFVARTTRWFSDWFMLAAVAVFILQQLQGLFLLGHWYYCQFIASVMK